MCARARVLRIERGRGRASGRASGRGGTDVRIDFHDLFDAAGLKQSRREPLLHRKHDSLRGLDADGSRAKLMPNRAQSDCSRRKARHRSSVGNPTAIGRGRLIM